MYEVIYRIVHDTSGIMSHREIKGPCNTIMTRGDHFIVEFYRTEDLPMDDQPDTTKPPYRVPSMAEIEAIPWNGHTVVSTFSGCGGSCLGYRMAGFHVLWANEFIPAAQEVYRLNHPTSILNTEDIRAVDPQMILDAIQLPAGSIDILDGSPPCASFSLAGKRSKGWGEVKPYSDTQQRVDDLFFEYARILKGLQPKVFVAENVSGLVKGVAKGYFKEILQALKACGYRVKAKLLDAQWLGVPQMRQRVIFMGVREDLNGEPTYPKPLSYRYSIRDAIPWVVKHGIAPSHQDWVEEQHDSNRFMVDSSQNPAPTILQGGVNKAAGIVEVTPALDNYAIGKEWDHLHQGQSSDKYFNLRKPSINSPCPTVTQTGGITGAASVVHPLEKRKFTIAELKRICAFPDDFQLTGSFTQQWERLGRAVPPVMMYQIARTIRDEVLSKCAE